MSERTYYVICEDNCKFEGMTKEQILAAIAEATGATPTHIDDAFITKIKEINKNAALKFWIGTQAEYNAIETPEANCFYIFTDSDELSEIEEIAKETAEEVCGKFGKVLYNGPSVTNGSSAISLTVEGISEYNLIYVVSQFGVTQLFIREGNKFVYSRNDIDNIEDETFSIKQYVFNVNNDTITVPVYTDLNNNENRNAYFDGTNFTVNLMEIGIRKIVGIM